MKAIGIILAGGSADNLNELTKNRALSAVPIAGSYRAIDFSLSNMTNSNISKVAVITQYNSRSLHDHLKSAKWWNLGRKQGGLFVLSPYISSNNSFWFRGTADSIYQNITYLKRSIEPYVVITSGDSICKIDYSEIIKNHVNKKADISVVYTELLNDNVKNYGVIQLNEYNRIIDFEEKPLEPVSNKISMGIYVISRTLLIDLLEKTASESRYDFVSDILIRYRKKLNLIGYEFKGYFKIPKNIKKYYDLNMDFLNLDILKQFTPFVFTKPYDLPPAKFNYNSVIKNSLTASGCIINGNIESSILSRKVYVDSNSTIKESIILEKCFIKENCYLQNVIIDKEVVIESNTKIIGTKENPIFINKENVKKITIN